MEKTGPGTGGRKARLEGIARIFATCKRDSHASKHIEALEPDLSRVKSRDYTITLLIPLCATGGRIERLGLTTYDYP